MSVISSIRCRWMEFGSLCSQNLIINDSLIRNILPFQTTSWLLWSVHRPRCQPFSLEPSTEVIGSGGHILNETICSYESRSTHQHCLPCLYKKIFLICVLFFVIACILSASFLLPFSCCKQSCVSGWPLPVLEAGRATMRPTLGMRMMSPHSFISLYRNAVFGVRHVTKHADKAFYCKSPFQYMWMR